MRLAPDVIVVPNAGIAGMMRWETTTIPIVVLVAGDLVAPGLVETLARPGRNVTGTQIVQLDLMGKRLQLLQEILGNPTRVAALWDLVTTPTRSVWDNTWKQFEALAQRLHMQALRHEVHIVGELEDRFRAMAAQRAQAVLVFGSPFMFTHARTLTALAAKYRIAAGRRPAHPVRGQKLTGAFYAAGRTVHSATTAVETPEDQT